MSDKMIQKRYVRRRRGNAVLDAALVLPILLSLTFGTVEYGYFFFVKHSLQGAAREGCRAAIVPSTTTTTPVIQAMAASLYAAGLNTSTLTLDNKYDISHTTSVTPGTGNPITVEIDVAWSSIGVRPLGLIGGTKIVKGVTVMRKEG
ncbi:MAG TPA: TadE/TadG family type IV pilus assembly protein [Tepidisphaeraceae bacterium]|nr:TadE/TadG family type IV pilus assembly protein [Tepidisphaeraceae bacterium]